MIQMLLEIKPFLNFLFCLTVGSINVVWTRLITIIFTSLYVKLGKLGGITILVQ